MAKINFLKVIVIPIVFFVVGYSLSFMLHSSKHNLTDEYMDALIDKFFNDHFAASMALDTYNLTLIHQNIVKNKITEKDKNTLKNIIKYNIDLMDKARKNNADWDKESTNIYLETIKMNNHFNKTENNESQKP